MEKDAIIRLYLQGKNKTQISEITKISRPTVRKYIQEYEHYRELLDNAETNEEKENIIIMSSAKPKYDASNRKRYKVTPELTKKLYELIEKNKELARTNKQKLMMKAKDMHRILVREGFDISYRSVCILISEYHPRSKEAYISRKMGIPVLLLKE